MPDRLIDRFPDVHDVLEHELANDATLGFVQRYRAHRFLAALRSNRRAVVR